MGAFIKLNQNTIYIFLFLLIVSALIAGCSNSTEPVDSGEARLILTAEKFSGNAPLNVKLSAKIAGNKDGISGRVPDYILFVSPGLTMIPSAFPDTSQPLTAEWDYENTYNWKGEYKFVLLYQGIKDSSDFELWSDTLIIRVN